VEKKGKGPKWTPFGGRKEADVPIKKWIRLRQTWNKLLIRSEKKEKKKNPKKENWEKKNFGEGKKPKCVTPPDIPVELARERLKVVSTIKKREKGPTEFGEKGDKWD